MINHTMAKVGFQGVMGLLGKMGCTWGTLIKIIDLGGGGTHIFEGGFI